MMQCDARHADAVGYPEGKVNGEKSADKPSLRHAKNVKKKLLIRRSTVRCGSPGP
jgi:hypothetical protein